LLASKSGPTAVRGQYYGIAAAIGKIGAFGGSWGKLFIILKVHVVLLMFLFSLIRVISFPAD
jgi:hypothetical protein